MSEIRVTFSGLISFVVGIGSLVTGLIFTLIVTRRLTPEEFGEWGLIGALTGYVLMFNPLISYWNTREVARGVDSGKTSLHSSLLFSFGAILVYLIIAKLVGSNVGVEFSVLFLAKSFIGALSLKVSNNKDIVVDSPPGITNPSTPSRCFGSLTPFDLMPKSEKTL